MFKPKKKETKEKIQEIKRAVEQEYPEDIEEEEIEDEYEEDVETIHPPKQRMKKQAFNVGDIIPVRELVGYQIIKGFDNNNEPVVSYTDKLNEAEILSFIYRNE